MSQVPSNGTCHLGLYKYSLRESVIYDANFASDEAEVSLVYEA